MPPVKSATTIIMNSHTYYCKINNTLHFDFVLSFRRRRCDDCYLCCTELWEPRLWSWRRADEGRFCQRTDLVGVVVSWNESVRKADYSDQGEDLGYYY